MAGKTAILVLVILPLVLNVAVKARSAGLTRESSENRQVSSVNRQESSVNRQEASGRGQESSVKDQESPGEDQESSGEDQDSSGNTVPKPDPNANSDAQSGNKSIGGAVAVPGSFVGR